MSHTTTSVQSIKDLPFRSILQTSIKAGKKRTKPQIIELHSIPALEYCPETGQVEKTEIQGENILEVGYEYAGTNATHMEGVQFGRYELMLTPYFIMQHMLYHMSTNELLRVDWDQLRFEEYQLNANGDLELI